MFGPGHAAAQPELVCAIVRAASSDWAARVICAALEDIAGALAEGGGVLPGNAGSGGGAWHAVAPMMRGVEVLAGAASCMDFAVQAKSRWENAAGALPAVSK